MEFIGYTAIIDAVVVVVSWFVLLGKQKKMQQVNQKIKYLSSYLIWTFVFLLLIAYTIFFVDPSKMMMGLLVADLALWISMVVFIMMMYAGTAGKQRGLWIGLFLIFAAMRTTWQVAFIQGIDTKALLGDGFYNFLSNLDQWLMYAVWIPSALVLIIVGLNSDSALVRLRSIFFAIGLLLISFTWAFRFLLAPDYSAEVGYVVISLGSVIGFILLLMGFLYKGKTSNMEGQMSSPNEMNNSTPQMN